MSAFNKLFLFLLTAFGIALGCLWIIGGSPVQHEVQTTISAKSQTVFACLVQPDLREQWITGLRSTELEQAGKMGSGAVFRSEIEWNDQVRSTTEEVQLYEKNELVTIRTSIDGVVTTSIFKLSPSAEQTGVSYQITLSRQPLARFFFWQDKRDLPSMLKQDLGRLKQLAESDPVIVAMEPLIEQKVDAGSKTDEDASRRGRTGLPDWPPEKSP